MGQRHRWAGSVLTFPRSVVLRSVLAVRLALMVIQLAISLLLAPVALLGCFALWNELPDDEAVASVKMPGEQVRAVTYSPDGRWIVSLFDNGVVRTWDANSLDEPKWTLSGLQRDADSVAIDPTCRSVSSGANGTVLVWDAASGDVTHRFTGHKRYVIGVAFTPDGKALFSCDAGGTFVHWDLRDEKREPSTVVLKAETPVLAMALSPSGDQLATAGKEGKVVIWDSASGALLHKLQGGTADAKTVAFSPDGKLVMAADRDGVLRFWEAKSGRFLRGVTDRQGWITSVAFSPDGSCIASAGPGGEAHLRDAVTGRLLYSFQGYKGLMNSVAFSPDGRRIVTGGGHWDESKGRTTRGEIKVWDCAGRPGLALFLILFPALAGLGGGLLVFEALKHFGRQLSALWSRIREFNRSLLDRFVRPLLPDRILAHGALGEARDDRGQVITHGGEVQDAIFLEGGLSLAAACRDEVQIFDLEAIDQAGERINTSRVRVPSGVGSGFSLAPGSGPMRLGAIGRDGKVSQLDARSGEVLTTIQAPAESHAVAVSPDGTQVAFASRGRSLSVRAMDGGDVRFEIETATWAKCLAFNSDGSRLAVAGTFLEVRDATTGRVLHSRGRESEGHRGSILTVAFRPEGTQLASGGEDGHILVWDLGGDQLVRRMNHGATITSVAFSPDGTWLAATGADGLVTLWDAATGKLRCRMKAGEPYSSAPAFVQPVPRLTFSPDSRRLACCVTRLRTDSYQQPPFNLDMIRQLVWEIQREQISLDGMICLWDLS